MLRCRCPSPPTCHRRPRPISEAPPSTTPSAPAATSPPISRLRRPRDDRQSRAGTRLPLPASPATTLAAPPAPATAAVAPSTPETTPAAPAAEPMKAAVDVPPPINRLPTGSRTCLLREDRVFRSQGRARSRSSTARATTRRCGRNGAASAERQGRVDAPEGRRHRRAQCVRLSGAGFRRGHHAGRARRRRVEADSSVLDYARHAQGGRMHWSQVSADIQYPEHPTDPADVLSNMSTAKDAAVALDGYNPPHKVYKALKIKLGELRGLGDGPVDDRRRSGVEVRRRQSQEASRSRGRSARAAAPRQARRHRKYRRYPL